MDTWQGKASNPTTLNKYLYAGGNPVMHIDPSGQMFGLGGFTMRMSMQATLSSISIGGRAVVQKMASKLMYHLASAQAKRWAYTALTAEGIYLSNLHEPISKGLEGFEKFTQSKKFNDPNGGKHMMDLWYPSGLEPTQKI